MWAQIINTLIGIWLMASPAILGYDGTAADSNHIVGPIIGTFAMVACWEATRSLRLANIPLGLWLCMSPWILGNMEMDTIVNHVACGTFVVALSLVKGKIKGKYGGGWKILFHRHEGPK